MEYVFGVLGFEHRYTVRFNMYRYRFIRHLPVAACTVFFLISRRIFYFILFCFMFIVQPLKNVKVKYKYWAENCDLLVPVPY